MTESPDHHLRDLANTLPVYAYRWAMTLENSPDHLVDAAMPLVAETLSIIAVLAAGEDRPETDGKPLDIATLLRLLDRAGTSAARRLSADPTDDAEAAAAATVQRGDQLLRDGGRLLAERGGSPVGTGAVVQINASGGGVPKTALPRASVDDRGIVGDTQRNRQHHGRPWQAVCVYSADIIAEWAAAGHPICNGAVGENLTVTGLPWPELRPGVELAVGDTVVLHVAAYAVPCGHQAQWFSDGSINRLSHEANPGFARLYAEVLSGGDIEPGDKISVR